MQDDQILIETLEEENRRLRDIIQVQQDVQNELSIEEIESSLQTHEKKVQEYEYQLMQTENLKKLQDLEKIRLELSQEIEEQLRKEFEEKFMKLAEETALLVKESNDLNK